MGDNTSHVQLSDSAGGGQPVDVLVHDSDSTSKNKSLSSSRDICDYWEPDHDNMVTTSPMEDISDRSDPISTLNLDPDHSPRSKQTYGNITSWMPTVAKGKLEVIQMITNVYFKNLIKNKQHDISTVLAGRDSYLKISLPFGDGSLSIFQDKRPNKPNYSYRAKHKRSTTPEDYSMTKKRKS